MSLPQSKKKIVKRLLKKGCSGCVAFGRFVLLQRCSACRQLILESKSRMAKSTFSDKVNLFFIFPFVFMCCMIQKRASEVNLCQNESCECFVNGVGCNETCCCFTHHPNEAVVNTFILV